MKRINSKARFVMSIALCMALIFSIGTGFAFADEVAEEAEVADEVAEEVVEEAEAGFPVEEFAPLEVIYVLNGENHYYTWAFPGEVVYVLGAPYADGFTGWVNDEVDVVDGAFVMPTYKVIFYGEYTQASADYTVISYCETPSGDYQQYSSETLSAPAGSYTSVSASEITGYAPMEIVQQLVKGDGSTVVSVYYKLVGAEYTIVSYALNPENQYEYIGSDKGFGTIGEFTQVTAPELENFTPVSSVEQEIIKADGSTVVNIYYDRVASTTTAAAATTTLQTDATEAETVEAAETESAESTEAVETDAAEAETVEATEAESVEIEDEATPLAGGQQFNYWYIVLGAAVIAGAWFIILLLKRRKDEDEAKA